MCRNAAAPAVGSKVRESLTTGSNCISFDLHPWALGLLDMSRTTVTHVHNPSGVSRENVVASRCECLCIWAGDRGTGIFDTDCSHLNALRCIHVAKLRDPMILTILSGLTSQSRAGAVTIHMEPADGALEALAAWNILLQLLAIGTGFPQNLLISSNVSGQSTDPNSRSCLSSSAHTS